MVWCEMLTSDYKDTILSAAWQRKWVFLRQRDYQRILEGGRDQEQTTSIPGKASRQLRPVTNQPALLVNPSPPPATET